VDRIVYYGLILPLAHVDFGRHRLVWNIIYYLLFIMVHSGQLSVGSVLKDSAKSKENPRELHVGKGESVEDIADGDGDR
jgi:hypothetical protein